jgi:hypothetical protein
MIELKRLIDAGSHAKNAADAFMQKVPNAEE